MSDYIHSGSNKMNKVEAYKNDNKLLLADKLGHAKVSSLKEQSLINTINTVATHDTDITQLKTDMNKVRGAYVYKGTVETEFDLPLNNNSVGDVYNVSLTGMNYAWNGENWDELGNSTVFALKVDGTIIQKVGTTLETPLNLQDCGICWGGNSQKFNSTIGITKSFYPSNTEREQLNNHIYTNTTQTFHYSGSTTLYQVGNGFGFSGLQAFNSPIIALYFGYPKAKLFKLGVQRQNTPSVTTAKTVGVLDGIELLLDSGHLLINQTKLINYIDSETKVKVIGTIQFGNYSSYSIPVTWDITLYGADALIPNYEQSQPEINSQPVLQLTTFLSDNSSYISEVDLSSFDQLQDVITLDTNIGNLTNLTTSDKTSLVTAINEIQAGLGNSGSDWEWNPTPIYEETLTEAFYYDDEDVNAYTIPIPATIIGNGLKAVRVVVDVGTEGVTTEPCNFQINGGGYSGGPIFGTFSTSSIYASGIWEFLAIPEHGLLIGIVALKPTRTASLVAWGDINPGISSNIKMGILRNVDGAQILIHSVHIIHKSLPIGTNIRVYAPLS